MMTARSILVAIIVHSVATAADNWPQFRGPDASAVATNSKVPIEFGPKKNLKWKTPLSLGHSSPCIWGDRIFLTGLDQGKLETICLDRVSGRIIWRQPAPVEKVEPAHRIGSPAAPTPTTDGERVYVSFGSFGLLAYNFDGKEQWRHPIPAPIVEFGTSSSPVLAGDRLILASDQDMGSFILAVDKRTGKKLWSTPRPEFRRGFATPFIWKHDGVEEIVLPGSLKLVSYDAADGKERWSIRGMARVANASPTAGDGLLFAVSWNIGGDSGDRLKMPDRAEFFAEHDKNKDQKLSLAEYPGGPFKDRFTQTDVNKDGFVTMTEYESMSDQFVKAENCIMAIRPGGKGDITDSHVVWKHNRSLPYVSSPLFLNGRVYTVRSGGMATCYEAKTGTVVYRDERLGVLGDYYASAIVGGGKIFLASQKGTVIVYQASSAPEVLAMNDLGEQVMATPAVVANTLFIRTEKHLMAFGE